MSFRVLLGALAALMLTFSIAAPAKGDVTLNLGNFVLSGGQSSQEIVITGLSGSVTSMDFKVDYLDFNGTGSDAASDLALQIFTPSGASTWWGGDGAFTVPGSTWQGTWSFFGSSTNSGHYEDLNNDFFVLGGGGNPWKFKIFNGWALGPSVGYNNVTVTLKGSIVPAPGAIALLGIAGIKGRRRRGS